MAKKAVSAFLLYHFNEHLNPNYDAMVVLFYY